MSFDLAVWKSERPLTPDEAQSIYEKLCEDEPPDEVPACREMEAFSEELLKRWPYDPEAPDDCPFENPHGSPRFQLLSVAWSRVAEVAPEVVSLALRHGLLCYDPQEGKVHLPAKPGGAIPKRPWWKFWT